MKTDDCFLFAVKIWCDVSELRLKMQQRSAAEVPPWKKGDLF
jgi:hypothetical protein